MSDQDATQPVAVKEDDGFVRIKLDAPVGSVISQQIDGGASTAYSPSQTSSNSDQGSSKDDSPNPVDNIDTSNPDADNIAQKVQEAAVKEQAAKQAAQQALESVKQSEEQAVKSQEQLKQQAEQAAKQIQTAQKQIEEAQEAQKSSKQEIQSEEGKSGFNVAGYKPADLAQALVKPPEPSNDNTSSSIDKQTQKQIKEGVSQIEEQVKATQKQVKRADKYITSAQKQAASAEKSQNKIISKITDIINNLMGEQGSSSTGMPAKTQPSQAFLILGGILFVLAIITLIFSKSLIWLLLAVVAIVQLGMGGFLKKQQQ